MKFEIDIKVIGISFLILIALILVSISSCLKANKISNKSSDIINKLKEEKRVEINTLKEETSKLNETIEMLKRQRSARKRIIGTSSTITEEEKNELLADLKFYGY